MFSTNVFSKSAFVAAIVGSSTAAFGQMEAPSSELRLNELSSLTIGQPDALHRGPSLSFASSNKDTWNTVLLVSGIVFVIGLAENDGTLEILGGLGALASLYETSSMRFHFGPNYREYDLMSTGGVSVGLSSIGRTQYGNLAPVKPCVSYSTRF